MQLTADDVYASIAWSADVEDDDAVLEVADKAPKLDIIKIDRLFVAKNGYGIFAKLNERGRKSFYDAKVVEIPSKLEAIARAECKHQPWMLNCMAGAGSGGPLEDEDPEKIEGLKRFAAVCLEASVLPCGVTVLTSKKPDFIRKEFNERTSIDQVMFYVELLVACGFTDVVCSPAEIEAIRARFEIDVNTPGLRRPSSDTGDQARVSTLGWALQAGAKRGVIGRDITKGDPAQNLDAIVAETITG